MLYPRAVIARSRRVPRGRAGAGRCLTPRPGAPGLPPLPPRFTERTMKKILLLGLVVCVVCLAGATAASARVAPVQGGAPADAHYRDGARLALEGRLSEAANAFER